MTSRHSVQKRATCCREQFRTSFDTQTIEWIDSTSRDSQKLRRHDPAWKFWWDSCKNCGQMVVIGSTSQCTSNLCWFLPFCEILQVTQLERTIHEITRRKLILTITPAGDLASECNADFSWCTYYHPIRCRWWWSSPHTSNRKHL